MVEDNEVNQKVASKLIEKMGFTVDVAHHGLDAIHFLKQQDYDLIFMDCQMPEMDGYQATAAIRKLERNKKRNIIIAMTANAMSGDRERCMFAGVDDHLAKPIRQRDLTEMLMTWLPHRMHREG